MFMEDLFNFGDFVDGNVSEKKIDTDKDVSKFEETSESQKDEDIIEEVDKEIEEEEETELESVPESLNEAVFIEEDDNYVLYKDKSELFSCDIYVEGAKTDETITRIIIESEEWTLMFPGDIENGKVEIPIRKLDIFDEGQTGKIRLEVIAEGSMFIPWEDDFKVKMSKKVTVSMNEKKKAPKKSEKNVSVKVNK